MTVYIKLETLDRRHKEYSRFKFRAYFEGPIAERAPKFIEIRNDLWACYGPSSERDVRMPGSDVSDRWVWHTEEYGNRRNFYLYLKGDEEASYFKLKWM